MEWGEYNVYKIYITGLLLYNADCILFTIFYPPNNVQKVTSVMMLSTKHGRNSTLYYKSFI